MQLVRSLLVAAVTCVAFHAVAADANFTFRGIGLGDALAKVEAEASKQFQTAMPTDAKVDTWTVLAADSTSASSDSCGYAAPAARRDDCLRAMYVLRPSGKVQVVLIGVTQSFKFGLPIEAFMNRIRASYGTPLAVFENAPDAMDKRNDTRKQTLLWGGSRLPKGGYAQPGFPFEEIKLVGGKFVSMLLVTSGSVVIGYKMRIADSDKIKAADDAYMAKRDADADRARREAVDKLKF